MNSIPPGTTLGQPVRRGSLREDAIPHAAPTCDDGDRCPLCGEPITFHLEPTEDGPEWLGHCVECNAIVEAML